ncbi:uncharacterized protein UV8b_06744 [Ustilaginoidea virens]|uniref:Mso1 N-terminal domain-containing protein n=1 Tax=Ustilaginoidea virens TaxID=1159556 RepID=A0A8E5MJD3_USTVR|nr:uncharacterized protein UV8b_06744 [Ustilaginoidea virens]QUC22503.1 hypothetical protein UV8b_06744 [Ustilaginoidea virens]
MTSWYSSILTRTTSQISSLRSTLLSSDNDGDTDDDTHVCRVLRNYYADKGRPLPAWLPPDPKTAAVPQPLYAQPQGASAGVGVGVGQPSPGLSSLWDSAPPAQPQSLRAGRRPREDVLPRPLPSQRAGSYQSAGAGGASAQDRLKQRLWGSGRQSPSPGGSRG